MSDTTDRRTQIRRDITRQMLNGAFWGGVVFFGPVIFIVALYYVGLLLPEQSKEADDPTPDSFGALHERVIEHRLT